MHKKMLDAAVDALWDAVQSKDEARIAQAREVLAKLLELLLR